MESIEYKCPNCNAELKFNPDTQKLDCEYCLSSFTIEQVKQACAEAEKGREDEFALYSLVERLAPEVIAEERRIYKGVCANVDFYSGFVYRMLGIPDELFTPLFATSRIAGWSAHRIEELINSNKIIRPAYKSVSPMREYTDMENRID